MQEIFTLSNIYNILKRIQERIPVGCDVSFTLQQEGGFCITAYIKNRALQKVFSEWQLRDMLNHDIIIENFVEELLFDIKQVYAKK